MVHSVLHFQGALPARQCPQMIKGTHNKADAGMVGSMAIGARLRAALPLWFSCN